MLPDTWRFPLPRTHTGVLLGNGMLGAMVWGEGNVLRVTLNRADFWDHRGGMPWVEGMSYARIRALLEAGDEAGLRALFEQRTAPPGEPARPSLLPLGRLELAFAAEASLVSARLDMQRGQVIVDLQAAGALHSVTLTMAMHAPVLHIGSSGGLPLPEPRRVTADDLIGAALQAISIPAPEHFSGQALSGWVQRRPADPPLCVGYRRADDGLWVALAYGDDAPAAQAAARALVERSAGAGAAALWAQSAAWWARYWQDVPRLELPNARLDFLYRYGMAKFAGMSSPDGGVPAGLQGPWIEEYQLPPWSGDYHFNINVQMCYWPAYRGNRLAHLLPLFDMLERWTPVLQENARIFAGIDDGLMLPHAVDDRCTCMGGFWTGSIDHGSTAWVADMLYRYALYAGDRGFLRQRAVPFLQGALRVYQALLERDCAGWALPVSVSPEYRGNRLDAWGRNASFQLACIHRLLEDLQAAAAALGETPDPQWAALQAGLPRAALVGPAGAEEIGLWEGLVLEESHRHHSHLAGICPFDVLDPDDPSWRPIFERSLRRWIGGGLGMWSGWCVPWASMLHARFGNADMAELLLELWERVFTNEGHGTLHDCQFPGFTLLGAWDGLAKTPRPEIMQLDAGMGATTAIMELLLQTRRGVNHLFAGAPARWERVAFEGLRTEGAFLVSAAREGGHVTQVEVTSAQGGEFRLANPWPERGAVSAGAPLAQRGALLALSLRPGERAVLRPR
jgi:alpha-L-fucosidase 2